MSAQSSALRPVVTSVAGTPANIAANVLSREITTPNASAFNALSVYVIPLLTLLTGQPSSVATQSDNQNTPKVIRIFCILDIRTAPEVPGFQKGAPMDGGAAFRFSIEMAHRRMIPAAVRPYRVRGMAPGVGCCSIRTKALPSAGLVATRASSASVGGLPSRALDSQQVCLLDYRRITKVPRVSAGSIVSSDGTTNCEESS